MRDSALSNSNLITFYSNVSSDLEKNPFEQTLLLQHPNYYKETDLDTKYETIQDMIASGRDAIIYMVRKSILNFDTTKNDVNKVHDALGDLIHEYTVFADRHISLYHTTRLQSFSEKRQEEIKKQQNFINNRVENFYLKQQEEKRDLEMIANCTKRENEELKAKVAELQKQNTKIQNDLAKTTIALEKSQDLLRKNTEHRLKNLANNFCKKGNK